MKARDRVRLKADGRVGTLFPTIYLLLSDGDDALSVAFDNGDGSGTTLNCFDGGRNAFEMIGTYDAKPDPIKCGTGKGKDCCIYLTAGVKGFECERFGGLHSTLNFKTMAAKRAPGEPYPECMNQVADYAPTKCPECGETLGSHAGREWKYFHQHVLYGPYPNPSPHPCSLVDAAFERDGTPIPGSAEARLEMSRAFHPNAKINLTPKQA